MHHRLAKSDIRELNERLAPFSVAFDKQDIIEIVEESGEKEYIVNKKVWFFEKEGKLIPTLRIALEDKMRLRRVTVDMGAIRFVTNGADVMRPGITAIEDGIGQGEIVVIVDQIHGKPLAIGEALLGSEEMRSAAGGKAVRTLHWVGDKRWSAKA